MTELNCEKLYLLVFNKTYFVRELKAAGHRVVTAAVPESFSLRNDEATSSRRFDLPFDEGSDVRDLLEKVPDFQTLDAIIYFDDSNPCLRACGFEHLQIPKIFVSVDAHIHHEVHPTLSAIFDLALVAQKDYLPLFQERTNSIWFPLWASDTPEPQNPKTIDVCFRGALDRKLRPARVEFLEQLGKLVKLDLDWQDYRQSFPSTKIAINETLAGDLNFRVFETMACGAMLLTPRTTNGLAELFEDRRDLVLYEEHNAAQAAELIKYYLENETERQSIAESGRQKVLQFHGAASRTRALLECIANLQKQPRSKKLPYPKIGSAARQYIHQLRCLKQRTDFQLRRLAEHGLNALIETLTIEKDPTDSNISALAVFITILVRTGETQRSIEILEHTLSLSQNNPTIAIFMIALLLDQGDSVRASEIALKVGLDPDLALKEAGRLYSQFAKTI